MLNLRKRIKELQDTTSSAEAKSICKEVLENYINLPESQIGSTLVEKLKSIEDADKSVAKFIQVSEKIASVNELGVAKSIAKIKESQIFAYPAVSYTINKIENALINAQAPEYMAIDPMIESIKAFIWDSTIEGIYNELREKRSSLNEHITVAQSIYKLSGAKGSFIYESVVNKLKDHFANPTESSRSSILEDIKKFNFSTDIKSLAESLSKIQAKKTSGVQVISENSNCSVSSIYSPVLLENGAEYFFVRGNFYGKADGKIAKIVENNVNALPENFRQICRIISSPSVFIKEGKVSFYLKRNKVEILENNNKVEVLFNGSKVSSSELAKNMVSAGLFRLEEAQVAYDVQSIAESFSNIYDLDFAKLIESNVHKGSYVILMKDGNNIYINKVNESMRSNEFFSGLNATQARNLILEFIGFDIKESMSEYLEKDEAEMKELREAQISILSNIAVVEANLTKVTTTLQDSFMASNPELTSLKDMLESEIAKLKADHRELTNRIKAFEAKSTSDAGHDVGDEVKLTETGDAATITSIDSSRDMVTVVTSKGQTKTLPLSGITSEEANIQTSHSKNGDTGSESSSANENEEVDDKKKD